MSEAKKVAIGVVSVVLSTAVLFALILMIVGKGDEPAPRLQLTLADGMVWLLGFGIEPFHGFF
jgi:hypothetical protein